MRDGASRALLGKNFSVENPYSNIVACVFKTVGDDRLLNTYISQDEDGSWIEKEAFPFDQPHKNQIRNKFIRNVFEKSQAFESDDIEVIAFTVRFQKEETKRIMNNDIYNAGAVLIACFFYIWFHTKSLFLTVASLFNVMMAIPISYYFYSIVFHIE